MTNSASSQANRTVTTHTRTNHFQQHRRSSRSASSSPSTLTASPGQATSYNGSVRSDHPRTTRCKACGVTLFRAVGQEYCPKCKKRVEVERHRPSSSHSDLTSRQSTRMAPPPRQSVGRSLAPLALPPSPRSRASSPPPPSASSSVPSFASFSPPSSVASSRPGSVASSRPGSVASSRPGSVASSRPGSVASSRPGSVASSRPDSVMSFRPGSVMSSRPGSLSFNLSSGLGAPVPIAGNSGGLVRTREFNHYIEEFPTHTDEFTFTHTRKFH